MRPKTSSKKRHNSHKSHKSHKKSKKFTKSSSKHVYVPTPEPTSSKSTDKMRRVKKTDADQATGAGILPVAYVEGKPLFLLGKEKYAKNWPDSNKYSTFAGKRDAGETILECAIREGYEESMGVLGSQEDIRKAISGGKKLIGIIKTKYHHTYVYEIPHNPVLPDIFDNVLNYFLEASKTYACTQKHGYFEKQSIKWFSADDLWNNRKSLRRKFNDSYVLKELIELVK